MSQSATPIPAAGGTTPRLSARHWFAIVALLLFVTWVGARRLNADGLWYDEWWSQYAAGSSQFGPPLSPLDIWQRVAAEDPWQTPGYAWALAAWSSAVGWTEFAGRALSLLAGLLSVAVVCRLGHDISRQPLVGLGAAAALGGSAWFIYYLHEMRVYALMVLLAALLLLLLYRYMMHARRAPGFARCAAFTLTAAALLYTHYFAAIAVAAVGLWHLARLLRGRPHRRWWLVPGCLLLAGLALLPWLAPAVEAMRLAQRANRVPFQGAEVLAVAGDMLSGFSSTSVALLALLALFSLRERAAWGVWLLAGVVLLGSLAAYQLFSVSEIRYGMALLPLLALIAGFGIFALGKQRVPPLMIAGIWLVGGLLAQDDFRVNKLLNHTQPQPIREMARILAPHLLAGDVVINHLSSDMISTIYANPMVQYLGSTPARLEIVENRFLPSLEAYAQRVREAAGDAQRVWVLADPRWPSAEWSLFVYLLRQENFYPCAALADRGDMRVLAYGRVDSRAPAARFGDQVEARLIGTPAIQNGTLPVWVGLDVDAPPDTYSFGLHLVDAAGTLHAQYDAGLPVEARSCRGIELPVNGLAPGEYRLLMLVYDWRTGQRLDGIGFDGAAGDSAVLAHIRQP